MAFSVDGLAGAAAVGSSGAAAVASVTKSKCHPIVKKLTKRSFDLV
jgi:hypothetical protein